MIYFIIGMNCIALAGAVIALIYSIRSYRNVSARLKEQQEWLKEYDEGKHR